MVLAGCDHRSKRGWWWCKVRYCHSHTKGVSWWRGTFCSINGSMKRDGGVVLGVTMVKGYDNGVKWVATRTEDYQCESDCL